MPENGFRWELFPPLRSILVLSVVFFGRAAIGYSQPPQRLVPPAPLGTPFVEIGPAANPFGPPPMAIGPAPLGSLFVYSSRLPPQPMSPPIFYPPSPYAVRRATPFESSVPGQPMLAAPELASPQAVDSPAAIGNLRISISERFLNRFIARDEQKPGDVRDFILGADVTGRQNTFTRLRFDLLPSSDKIRGMFVLNGSTESQTTGVTPQAMVDVASHQNFVAVKEVFFDGFALTTRHAVVHVQARNQTLGATTPLSGTLIGGIADRIAYRAAERKQPQAEAVARDRVAERVYPEFDNEIDKQLALANDQLEGTVRRYLRMASLIPAKQQVSSGDFLMNYSAQIGSEALSGSSVSVSSQFGKDDGVCVLIHESLLNSLIGRTGLKGMKTTDKQLRSYFAPYEFTSSADNLEKSEPPIAMPGLTNVVTDIEFDEEDPLSVEIKDDRTLVTMRGSFKPAGQELMPPLAVKIEYKSQVIGEKIVVSPGKVQVSLLKDDGENSATSHIALKIMTQAIEANLTKLAFDRTLPSSIWSFGGELPRLSAMRSKDGWVAISID